MIATARARPKICRPHRLLRWSRPGMHRPKSAGDRGRASSGLFFFDDRRPQHATPRDTARSTEVRADGRREEAGYHHQGSSPDHRWGSGGAEAEDRALAPGQACQGGDRRCGPIHCEGNRRTQASLVLPGGHEAFGTWDDRMARFGNAIGA